MLFKLEGNVFLPLHYSFTIITRLFCTKQPIIFFRDFIGWKKCREVEIFRLFRFVFSVFKQRKILFSLRWILSKTTTPQEKSIRCQNKIAKDSEPKENLFLIARAKAEKKLFFDFKWNFFYWGNSDGFLSNFGFSSKLFAQI